MERRKFGLGLIGVLFAVPSAVVDAAASPAKVPDQNPNNVKQELLRILSDNNIFFEDGGVRIGNSYIYFEANGAMTTRSPSGLWPPHNSYTIKRH